MPILYVTHAIDEVLRLATAIVLLDHGQMVAAGALVDVAAQPVATALFGLDIGALAFGRITEHDTRFGQTHIGFDGFELRVPRVALPVGAAVRARIPARDVALALTRPGDVSINNRIEGRIETIRPLNESGSQVEVLVRVAPATQLRALVTREAVERLALQPGLSVWCLIKSVALDAGTLALASGKAATRGDAANDALPGGRGRAPLRRVAPSSSRSAASAAPTARRSAARYRATTRAPSAVSAVAPPVLRPGVLTTTGSTNSSLSSPTSSQARLYDMPSARAAPASEPSRSMCSSSAILPGPSRPSAKSMRNDRRGGLLILRRPPRIAQLGV